MPSFGEYPVSQLYKVGVGRRPRPADRETEWHGGLFKMAENKWVTGVKKHPYNSEVMGPLLRGSGYLVTGYM